MITSARPEIERFSLLRFKGGLIKKSTVCNRWFSLDFRRLLSLRGTIEGESRFSWTVNFAARRKQAREDMKPFLANAEAARAAAVSLKEKLKALKAANPKDGKIEVLEKQIWEQEKVAREAQAKANAIDAAVFDLKAVKSSLTDLAKPVGAWAGSQPLIPKGKRSGLRDNGKRFVVR